MKLIFEGRIITGGFALLAILFVVTGLSGHNTRRLTTAPEQHQKEN